MCVQRGDRSRVCVIRSYGQSMGVASECHRKARGGGGGAASYHTSISLLRITRIQLCVRRLRRSNRYIYLPCGYSAGVNSRMGVDTTLDSGPLDASIHQHMDQHETRRNTLFLTFQLRSFVCGWCVRSRRVSLNSQLHSNRDCESESTFEFALP